MGKLLCGDPLHSTRLLDKGWRDSLGTIGTDKDPDKIDEGARCEACAPHIPPAPPPEKSPLEKELETAKSDLADIKARLVSLESAVAVPVK